MKGKRKQPEMKNQILLTILLCTAIAVFSSSCEETNYVVNSENIPDATQGQIDELNKTKNLLLGIQAFDPEEHTPAIRSQHNTWGLLTPDKRNLGGIFNRYGTEKEINDAYDWNILIHPFDEYRYIYDLALQSSYKDVSQWPGCIDPAIQMQRCSADDYNQNPCMWAEISPYHLVLNDNIWFKGTNDEHCKEGAYLKYYDTVGVYGYPVNDKKHGYNPEIHPAQQIWFRNKSRTKPGSQYFWLMFLQDASQRFGDWVCSPLYGQYKIAFSINPDIFNAAIFDPLIMNIRIAHRDDLVTREFSTYRKDCDNGFSHTLVVDGRKLVTVNEEEINEHDLDLGIQFAEVTKQQDGTIQGYVQISMVLGDYDTDEIGVCVLELEVIKDKKKIKTAID